ncbi:hypothetical protein [Delftia acidovorans]|uniref:hypothetical protein n=1 Tax=Delftia acidovorans TaxID=80866 RepID=UPI00034E5FB2|nr:hypothetical protein [Delftia acidovorans]EPD46310.1 hypothetical protein HMPREF9702_00333 [Delftia acidovorans CCUG 15835]
MLELFSTRPDGSAPRTEVLEFRTLMGISRNGTEQRTASRAYPRVSFSGLYIFPAAELPTALANLRSGLPALAPLYHVPAIRTGGNFSFPFARSVTVNNPLRMLKRRAGSGALEVSSDPAAAGFTAAWPLLEVQVGESATSVDTRIHTLHQSTFTLEATEAFPWFTPAAAPAYPLPAPRFLRHNFSSALKSAASVDADVLDAGFVKSRVVRFTKDSLQISLLLGGKAQIDAFRLFVCALQGAAGSFTWSRPGASVPGIWRLGSDVISIQHVTADVATCNLTLVELK